jgi:hypothetical protein
MYKDPKHPHRKIVEVYNPPIKIKYTNGRDDKAIAYYKFENNSCFYYHLDIYERYGKPYEYIGGNWDVDNCTLIEEPKNNKEALRFLEKNW